jgi:integrase
MSATDPFSLNAGAVPPAATPASARRRLRPADIAVGAPMAAQIIDALVLLVPVLAVAWLLACAPDDYVIPARRPSNPSVENPLERVSRSSLKPPGHLAGGLGRRAQSGHRGTRSSHLLRHAHRDHVAKYAGLRAAQALLGHASVDTTASTDVEKPGLDELSITVHGFTYRATAGYPREHPVIPHKATTGIEPV